MDTGVIVKKGAKDNMLVEIDTNDEIETIINKYSNMVFQLALAKTKSKEMAEDVFQEVFIKLIKKKRKFENKEHEKAWIIRVTLNCCKDLWNSAWVRHTVPLEEDYENKITMDSNQDVYEAVMKLPEKYRIPIHLFYYEELSIAEIGMALKLNKNTVATRLKRAREILKEKMGGYYDGF